MKKTFIIILVALSCKSAGTYNPNERAKDSITAFLKKTMNDPKSYESVSFGKLDTIYWDFSESEEYKIHYDKRRKMHKGEISTDSIIRDYKRISDSFVPTIKNYEMEHSARGTNAMGALIFRSTVFILDSNLSVVDIKD